VSRTSKTGPVPRGLIPDDHPLSFDRYLKGLATGNWENAEHERALSEGTLNIAGFHPHELRHTAASLAIASGADVKVVQQMLGHKSATMTLDLYGHLFGDRLDVVADAMDAARTAALSDVYRRGGDRVTIGSQLAIG
jgi:integrase